MLARPLLGAIPIATCHSRGLERWLVSMRSLSATALRMPNHSAAPMLSLAQSTEGAW